MGREVSHIETQGIIVMTEKERERETVGRVVGYVKCEMVRLVACEMVKLIETAIVPIVCIDLAGLINGWNVSFFLFLFTVLMPNKHVK